MSLDRFDINLKISLLLIGYHKTALDETHFFLNQGLSVLNAIHRLTEPFTLCADLHDTEYKSVKSKSRSRRCTPCGALLLKNTEQHIKYRSFIDTMLKCCMAFYRMMFFVFHR